MYNKAAILRKRLEVQGFKGYSDQELGSFSFGIRFAYGLSLALLLIGFIFKSVPLLLAIAGLAFLGVILPRHPFDYLYNWSVAPLLHKPAIPRRTAQSKFAFAIATVMLIIISILFGQEYFVFGYLLAVILTITALLVTTTNICIPSMIYNFLKKIINRSSQP